MGEDGQAGLLPAARELRDLHAGFWRRVLAYIIDILIVDFVLVGTLVGIVVLERAHPQWSFYPFLVFWFLEMAAIWLYFALFECSRLQATPGKLVVRLAVTDLYGRRIGFGRATGRFFAKLLSGLILDIGYMMAGWTTRKQALHDMLAGTCVVRKSGLENLQTSGYSGTTATPLTPGWVIALAGVGAGLGGLAILGIVAAIAIPVYVNYTVQLQIYDATTLMANSARAMLRNYSNTGVWPTSISDVDPAAARVPAGRYTRVLKLVDCRSEVCGIEATIRRDSYVNPRIAGRTVELWTPDGGLSWYCGPGSNNPIDMSVLPPNCRSPGAP